MKRSRSLDGLSNCSYYMGAICVSDENYEVRCYRFGTGNPFLVVVQNNWELNPDGNFTVKPLMEAHLRGDNFRFMTNTTEYPDVDFVELAKKTLEKWSENGY